MYFSSLDFLKILLAVIALSVTAFSQSGKKDVQATPTPSVSAFPTKENDAARTVEPKDEFQFVLEGSPGRFFEELNRLGKLGFRVTKAFNYGGDATSSQKYAAALKFDPEARYEYDGLTSPNRRFIESRLNYKARQGFAVTHILPVTACDAVDDADADRDEFPISGIFRLAKADLFLLERQMGKTEQSREYKVYTGKIGIGKSPAADLQTALDGAPAGFQPIKVLFNKSGNFDFSISILLEKDLKNTVAEKIQYKFIKEVNGFEKEISLQTQNGFQLVAGRRIGLVKLALLAKVPGDAASYVLLDADKYQKEFDKKITAGQIYKGMFLGDTDCDENETVGAKLVFAQTSGEGNPKYEYKFLKLSEKNRYPNETEFVERIKKHIREGYRIRDIFYAEGLTAVLEK